MSPLEEFHQKKRSGLYEDTVSGQDTIEDPRPKTKTHDPRTFKDNVAVVIRGFTKDLMELERKLANTQDFVMKLLVAVILLLFVILFCAYKILSSDSKPLATTKTIKEKVYVKSSEDKWRKKYCYETGDWNACLAYKENLPARARVGRWDL